jgi:CheY-like chemotaxis protein
MMPDMDGIETLHRIRENKTGDADKTVYVALTANAVSGAREMYLSEGFEDYLSKPVDGNELEEMVMKYLPDDKLERLDTDDEILDDNTLKMADEDPLADLDMIPEINRKSGIVNCGSKDGYVTILETFHRSAEEKAEEIERYLEAGDIKNLTVKVHALKSSARIIGALQLSEKAAALEEAGKAEDIETIRRDIPVLLSEFRELNGKLSFLDKSSGTGKEITPEMIKEAFATVCEIAESMDFGMMEDLIRDLREYSFPQEEKEVLDDIAKKLNELDWDGIGKCAKSVLYKN